MSETLHNQMEQGAPRGQVRIEDPRPEAVNLSFEVSDLVYYYRDGNTPTGIQRVQQELVLEYLKSGNDQVSSFVVYDGNIQKWRAISPEWLLSLVATARSFHGSRELWREQYRKFADKLVSFPLRQFERGDWLLNVGASWSLTSYFVQIRSLQRRGVRCAFFVHDCIPVRHPAYFEYHHTVDYTHWLAQVRDTADVVICNSETTRADYLEHAKPESVDGVRVCRLDASWLNDNVSTEADAAVSEVLSNLGIFDDDFVLSVGTIEPRKNHIALVHVWDKLRNTHPAGAPKLLCVGRIGWKSDAIISQAKALGLADNQVFFAGALSDDVLSLLYKRCLFTVYLSYYEGWGLPITESLSAGKICVAGSSAALLESGAGCATHVDERSETSIHETIAKLIDDPVARLSGRQKIRDTYRPRKWSDIANDLFGIISTSTVAKPVSAALPVLEMNTLYRFGRLGPIADLINPRAAEIFCVGQSWHQPERWGNWTAKEVTELGFRVDRSNFPATIFLGIVSPPGGANVNISMNGKLVRGFSNMSGQKIVRLSLADVGGESSPGTYVPVRIRTSVSRMQNMRDIADSADSRQLGLGFHYLIAFDKLSLIERLEFLERIVSGDISEV